ncbi:hypothetical protein EIK77_002482, partial [Talaromyces pinophilus]
PSLLLILCVIILVGNTLYPCLLRFTIWAMRKVLPNKGIWGLWRQALDFTLVYSQSVYRYLFPTWHTWLLFGVILALNSILWVAFELLSLTANAEIEALPIGDRILDGLFQAL